MLSSGSALIFEVDRQYGSAGQSAVAEFGRRRRVWWEKTQSVKDSSGFLRVGQVWRAANLARTQAPTRTVYVVQRPRKGSGEVLTVVMRRYVRDVLVVKRTLSEQEYRRLKKQSDARGLERLFRMSMQIGASEAQRLRRAIDGAVRADLARFRAWVVNEAGSSVSPALKKWYLSSGFAALYLRRGRSATIKALGGSS